jgi:hypothetical protein
MFGKTLRLVSLLPLLAVTALSGAAFAVEPSGNAVRVERITNADGPGGARVLVSEAPVFTGDRITTNPNGLAQIIFADETKIVVGPNSNLFIDSFVFNPDNTARDVTVSAVKGFFRFISGNSPSDAYSIRTPTMTLGVRGTVLDIQANGPISRVIFLSGSGFGTDSSGQTTNFESGCTLYVAQNGAVSTPQGLSLQQQLAAYFPLINDQSDLNPEFRADTSSCPTIDGRIFGTPSGTSGVGEQIREVQPPQPSDDSDDDYDDDYDDYGDDEGGCDDC